MNRFLGLSLLSLGLVAGLAACDSAGADGRTHVTLRLTDAPFPFDLADSANVTIARVELVGTDTADADSRVVLYDGAPFSVNLLDLRDGIDTTMASLNVPAGDYRQLRFLVDGDARVVFSDGRTFDLRIPSGAQSGIKVNLPEGGIGAAGDSADVLVDFDVERSFVVRGGSVDSPGFNGFLFKPVLHVESLEINDAPVDTTGTNG